MAKKNVTRQYVPIDLYVLRVEKLQPFDIYFKHEIGPERYELCARCGRRFTSRLRQKLFMNRVKTVYVQEDDYEAYRQYVETYVPDMLQDALLGGDHKTAAVYETVRYALEGAFKQPDAAMFARTRRAVTALVAMLLQEPASAGRLIRMAAYDYATVTHSLNVGVFGTAFVRELYPQMPVQELCGLALGFFLHDIGKAHISDDILHKPGPLNDDEWHVIRAHPQQGYAMLTGAGVLGEEAALAVLQHHERESGAGYPQGLSGDRIHPYARMCAVVDTFDAMTTRRSHQDACTAFESLGIIKEKFIAEGGDREFFVKFVKLFSGKKQVV